MRLFRSHRPSAFIVGPKTASPKKRPALPLIIGAIALLQMIGSGVYPMAKIGLEVIDPFVFAFYRYILASAVLLTLTRFIKRDPPIARNDWKYIAGLGLLIIIFNQTMFVIGQKLTGAGHGAVLFSTTPVWVFLLALIHLKEKATWRRTLGIIMATGGVMVIMLSGAIDVSTDYLIGDLIILVSVLAWGYYTVFGKRMVERYGALRVTAYALSIGALAYLPFGIYVAAKFDYSQTTLVSWISVAYLALGLSGIVYVLWYWLLKHLEASRIAIYHNVQPIVASTIAYFFLGEPLTTAFIVGGAIVLTGVVITEV
ncbi:EamA family transporter [candidate division GN15 bacterium]|nr:EamA family transporter [candidate division GN15 bacterium]